MTERVVDAGLAVRWDPNIEHGILLTTETGFASLRVLPHPDDPDQRDVVFVWDGVRTARLEEPNDEARDGHRLAPAGLVGLLWAGEVLESRLVSELAARNERHPPHVAELYVGLRHWIIPLKGRVAEVVAARCRVDRDIERRPPKN